MKASNIKFIKLKKGKNKLDEKGMSLALQTWILSTTNAGLISLALHRHCRKFVKELQEIPLSEEYQNYD